MEGPHLGQVRWVETLAKFGLKANGEFRNEGLAVLGPLVPLLFLLDNDPPDLPIGRHHRRIDGTVGPGAGLTQDRLDPLIGLLNAGGRWHDSLQ